MLAGRLGDAEIQYRVLIERGETRWATAASLNLAWILHQAGQAEEALSVLRNARLRNPDDGRIPIELSKRLSALGDLDEAVRVLREFLESAVNNSTVRLHLAGMLRQPRSSRYHQNELWILFNEDPVNGRLCRYMFWYLAGLRDYEGAALVLKRYGEAGGQTDSAWYLHLEALVKAIQGDLERALALLSTSIDLRQDSGPLYNRGVIRMRQGQWDEAEADLWHAFELEKRTSDRDSVKSRIRVALGELFLQKGNLSAAYRELKYALEMDPSNGRAVVLLKELEKKHQR
jgi:tetratricopeptide (TPR) repeat protein